MNCALDNSWRRRVNAFEQRAFGTEYLRRRHFNRHIVYHCNPIQCLLYWLCFDPFVSTEYQNKFSVCLNTSIEL